MSLPPLPEAAHADYLTDALRRAGVLRDGRVREVVTESSKATVLSRIIRLRLHYDDAPDDAPATVILKTDLPEGPGSRWQAGRGEVAFYNEIAPQTPPGLLPRCFDARWSETTKAWHLLLEDLTDSHMSAGEWPLPPTIAQCRQIITSLARFHAAWWDDPRLGVSIGAWRSNDSATLQGFAANVARFTERLGDRMGTERREFYQQLIDAGPRLAARYHSHRDITIIHGDAHVWNTFLPRNDTDNVCLFDWEGWRLDTATNDLAYMMALHWFPDHRRRCESALLDHYHACLVAHGVSGYDRRALQDDYLLSVLWQATTPVWQAVNGIPAWIWWNHFERIFLAIDDLGCRALLDG
jgi:hypothetical protein